ncbi:hypothetical protein Syun_018884 [Stephania yunnanensis]|uniref:Uncharacterized protein n=1 Tax=Stephania yunnanensis TaxID=152371 RepID=A0AAP0NVF0_9MAGN
MDGVGSEDNVVDIKGADSPSTSSDAEDEMATSFPCGPTTLELLPSFHHHVLLDIWRNKRNRRTFDVALRFRSMPKTNVMAENAIAMADAVIAFLSGFEEEEEDTMTPQPPKAMELQHPLPQLWLIRQALNMPQKLGNRFRCLSSI